MSTYFFIFSCLCICAANASPRERRQGYQPYQQPYYQNQYQQPSQYNPFPAQQLAAYSQYTQPQQYGSYSASMTCDQITVSPIVQDCMETKTGLMFLMLQNLTWNNAQRACQGIHPAATLATIRNTDDYRAMMILSGAASIMWIGLYSQPSQSYPSYPSAMGSTNFQWVENNMPLESNYTQWLGGYPQPGGGNCVYASLAAFPGSLNSPPVGAYTVDCGWANGDCNIQANPLCKLRQQMTFAG